MTDPAATYEPVVRPVESDEIDHPPTNTGIPHAKLPLWLFPGPECPPFGGLLSTSPPYPPTSLLGPNPPDPATRSSSRFPPSRLVRCPPTRSAISHDRQHPNTAR